MVEQPAAERWEQAAEVTQVYEAELLALRLREAGIDARVLDQSFRQEPLPSVRSFAVVRVMVPARDIEAARRVVAEPGGLPEGAEEASEAAPDDEGSRKQG